MDVTFWVIQAVLLAPVLFMAASAGMEDNRDKPRQGKALPPVGHGRDQRSDRNLRAGRSGQMAVVVGGLSQFSIEQQARLVVLRTFVQEARGRGALTDDMLGDDDGPSVDSAIDERPAPRRLRRPSSHQLLLAGGILLMLVGLAGVVRTSLAMDRLEYSGGSAAGGLSPMTRLVPGLISSPQKYLSALNGASGSGAAGSDPIYALGFLSQKQAMDRWEALLGIGLSVLIFANAARASAASASSGDESDDTSVAFDVAPFVLVAAVLFAALSFFEIS